jgi:hypothetical protein
VREVLRGFRAVALGRGAIRLPWERGSVFLQLIGATHVLLCNLCVGCSGGNAAEEAAEAEEEGVAGATTSLAADPGSALGDAKSALAQRAGSGSNQPSEGTSYVERIAMGVDPDMALQQLPAPLTTHRMQFFPADFADLSQLKCAPWLDDYTHALGGGYTHLGRVTRTWPGGTHTWLGLTHTWLEGTHTWLGLTHTWLEGTHTWLGLTHTWLGGTHIWLGLTHTPAAQVRAPRPGGAIDGFGVNWTKGDSGGR